MHKDKFTKYEKRLQARANADMSEYQRLVTDNKELQADLIALRAKYDLPFQDAPAYHSWLKKQVNEALEIAKRDDIIGNVPIPIVDNLNAELDELAKKHGVTKWRQEIGGLALFGRAGSRSFSMGLPSIKLDPNSGETPKYEIVIPPDFDATNPIALNVLYLMRRSFDKPPHPQPMKDDPAKMDWRPVWEWHNRHPEITDKEIAQMLGVNRVTVTRRFNELDAEYPATK